MTYKKPDTDIWSFQRQDDRGPWRSGVESGNVIGFFKVRRPAIMSSVLIWMN